LSGLCPRALLGSRDPSDSSAAGSSRPLPFFAAASVWHAPGIKKSLEFC